MSANFDRLLITNIELAKVELLLLLNNCHASAKLSARVSLCQFGTIVDCCHTSQFVAAPCEPL